ncbi:ubiquinol oxidase subunit II [Sphingomonas abietis]|uniref:Ubiquinol oxidase subunit 2 n=1 Tax=Sphingomonas abietis TaxID=3012344 RepID=A0ABY7NQE1_9SPHN|nr:ubiquinol oxidase subunit II [Sphingomonas abietis]WBO22154.1 ubiquinol oxidase subunit II [Sphingomonas abietis]
MIRSTSRALAARILPLTPLLLLGGCSWDLFDPAGAIAVENLHTTLWATALMLIVVIPVIVMTLAFAWRYRSSNTAADYAPEWSHSNRIEVVIWVVPALIVLSLAVICYRTTHDLDPYRPIASSQKPLEVQVVALDWKWLFIYPEQGVASVNELAMPVDRPVHFTITSDGVMNSFFIPKLGTQVYAMAGMQTQLSLIANKAGTYKGISANFSGDGFADMGFEAKATDQQGFDAWVKQAKASSASLDAGGYAALAQQSHHDPVRVYGNVAPQMFQTVLTKDMNHAAAGQPQAADMNGMPMPAKQD